MSRTTLPLAAALAVLCALPPAAKAPAAVPSDEVRLLGRLHGLFEHEMDLGRLAQRRGLSGLTRKLGARLEFDHDEADARLLRRAYRRGLTVPERDQDPEDRLRGERLRTLQGPDFDRAFADAVDEDQARAAALLHAERALTADRRTRRDMDALLPLVDEHRKLAHYLQRRS
jgi:putative membrane protein